MLDNTNSSAFGLLSHLGASLLAAFDFLFRPRLWGRWRRIDELFEIVSPSPMFCVNDT